MKEKDNTCPKCNSENVAPIFYFIFSPDNPIWHCNNCGYEWK